MEKGGASGERDGIEDPEHSRAVAPAPRSATRCSGVCLWIVAWVVPWPEPAHLRSSALRLGRAWVRQPSLRRLSAMGSRPTG